MNAKWRNKKVLITGGFGFIGSNLAHKCLMLGANVTIYDCLDKRSGGNEYNIKDIRSSLRIIRKDIRDYASLAEQVRKHRVIYNCAAYTSHLNSMKEPLNDIDVNCIGAINILEAARQYNREAKIVQVGTSTQIGKMRFSPINEMHPEFPVDVYSANKCSAEKYMLIYNSAYKIDTAVIRLANVFGPRSNIKSPDFGVINYFIGRALQNKELTIFGNGSQIRNIIYVDDSVEALITAGGSSKSRGKIFFAVSDKHYSIAQMAKLICKQVGGKISFSPWPSERKSIEVGDAIISNKKIKQELGWKQLFDIEKGLKKTKEYFLGCLDRYL